MGDASEELKSSSVNMCCSHLQGSRGWILKAHLLESVAKTIQNHTVGPRKTQNRVRKIRFCPENSNNHFSRLKISQRIQKKWVSKNFDHRDPLRSGVEVLKIAKYEHFSEKSIPLKFYLWIVSLRRRFTPGNTFQRVVISSYSVKNCY